MPELSTRGVRESLGRTYRGSRELRLRLRFAGALLLLVLPLLAAAWAFGSYAASNEKSRTDTKLTASLLGASNVYRRLIATRELTATHLAASSDVQRALRDRDHAALAGLRRAHPGIQFLTGEPTEGPAPGVVRRSIKVLVGTRSVGTVVVDIALTHKVLAQIADEAGLLEQHEIAVAERGGRVVAGSIPLSGTLGSAGEQPSTIDLRTGRYRVVAAPIAPDTRLGILAEIDDAATSIRDRILAIGLLILAAVMVMAYALAPALARARVAQQQRAIAERVLAHIADGVLLLDSEGIVRFWNRAAEKITGLTAARVVGRRVRDAVPGWEAASPQIPIGDAHTLQGPIASATVPLEIHSGEVWLAASAVRFADGTVYTFRDISEDERLDQAKTDFVATVSHELRTPLASVFGAALTLRKRYSTLEPWRRDQLLELLADQANRLTTIIDEILLASKLATRLDPSGHEDANARFDADRLARTVVQAAQLHAPTGIHIALSTPPWLPDATGDGEKVAQVLTNLVENAVKYSPSGGRIDVLLEQEGERVRFEVRDEGLGIPLDEQERIFNKFYRLDPNLTRGIGGTGLGLYICRELVRRMGGEIHVASALGEGSRFWFDLPVAPTAAHVAAPVGSA